MASSCLNIPPDRRGLFHENDVERLKQLGEVLTSTFAQNLAAGAKLTAEVVDGESVGDVAALLDDNPDTFWTTTDGPTAVTLNVELPAPVRANCLMLQEHIASGQRVEAFTLEVFADGQWQPVVTSTVIGHKRLVRFPDSTHLQVPDSLHAVSCPSDAGELGTLFCSGNSCAAEVFP